MSFSIHRHEHCHMGIPITSRDHVFLYSCKRNIDVLLLSHYLQMILKYLELNSASDYNLKLLEVWAIRWEMYFKMQCQKKV